MKFQKIATIVIIIMLLINTASNIYMANELRKISNRTYYIMSDTLYIKEMMSAP